MNIHKIKKRVREAQGESMADPGEDEPHTAWGLVTTGVIWAIKTYLGWLKKYNIGLIQLEIFHDFTKITIKKIAGYVPTDGAFHHHG